MFSYNIVFIPAIFVLTVLLTFLFFGNTKYALGSADEERMIADETGDEPNSKYYV